MSGAINLTPTWVASLETNMRKIVATDFERLSTDAAAKFSCFAKEVPSLSMKEQFMWVIDTAFMDYTDKYGGTVEFQELQMAYHEFENSAVATGYEINRFKLEDLDGGGVSMAAEYARQMAFKAAYWPVQQVLKAVNNGHLATSLTYDGLPFFSASHLLNPINAATGTYSNLIAAKPIDRTNAATLDIAFNNLCDVVASIETFKNPDGLTPRNLKIKGIAVPPALRGRAVQLTNAKFIAQAVGSAGGSGDIEAVVSNWGFGQPYVFPELGAAFGGSDTSYYIMIEDAGTSTVGAIGYSNREPFRVVYNGEMTDADLSRANKLQWVLRARNNTFYMHPYLLIKVNAT